jgi:L-2,4-diaminobutyrate decarboxylase
LRKIILTGPESTGKSTLAKMLSKALNAPLVKEYAREYLEQRGGSYKEKDLLKIAIGQAAKESSMDVQCGVSDEQQYLICDTSFLVLKIWSEYRYSRCNGLIIKELKKNRNAIYFLCGTDIPWEYDQLRENPDDRQELYNIYKEELTSAGVEFYELKGTPNKRLKRVIKIVSNIKMKKNLLKEIYHPENFREQGHELIETLADYLSAAQSEKSSVNDWHFPDEELKFWKKKKKSKDTFKQLTSNVVQRSIKVHHPKYLGHQVAVPMPLSTLAGLTSNFLNNGMALYEMGAVSSAMEKVVIDNFCQAIGYDEMSGGVLTSGGTLANLTALLAARKAIAKDDIWNEGHGEKLAIMVSEEAHYCVDRAARIMGLGTKGIIKIPSNKSYQMRTDLLDKEFQKAKKQGLKVIAVIGSACSTSTGSYDDLIAISDFCQARKIWFHVDGAHGAAVVFSKKYKILVKGIERADSVVMDGHKMLGASALVTALMFKDEKDSYTVFHQKAQYLWADADAPEWFNYGKRTFECTKSMMSFKLFTILQQYGTNAFRDYVEVNYDLARLFAKDLKQNPKFNLAMQPQSNIICFRLKNKKWGRKKVNALNSQVRKELLEEGEFYFVQTELKGKIYLRTTLMNPFTRRKHLKKLIERIEEKAKEVAANM